MGEQHLLAFLRQAETGVESAIGSGAVLAGRPNQQEFPGSNADAGWNYPAERTVIVIRQAIPPQADGIGAGIVQLDPVFEITIFIGNSCVVGSLDFVDHHLRKGRAGR